MDNRGIWPLPEDGEMLRVLDNVPGGVVRFAFQGEFSLLCANGEFYRLLGVSEAEYAARFGRSLPLGLDAAESERIRALFAADGVSEVRFDYRQELPDRRLRRIFVQVRRAGEAAVFDGIFTDAAALWPGEGTLEREAVQAVRGLTGSVLFEYDLRERAMRVLAATPQAPLPQGAILRDYRRFLLERRIVFAEDEAAFEAMCDQFDRGAAMVDAELRLRNADGVYVWCKVCASAVYDERGLSAKLIGRIENIDLQKRETERLKEKSQRDPLTSFYNKVVIEETVDAYFRQERRAVQCAFMVIDIDNFKSINDTHGHLFGDAVLMEVAGALQGIFRKTDLIGRIGGDEFVVLMKGVKSVAAVEAKAREICETFRSFSMGEKNMQKISGSVGISLYPEHGDTYRCLFEKADQALYATKGFRKDDFTIFGMEEKRENFPMDGAALPRQRCGQKKLSLIRIFELLFDTNDIERGIQTVVELIGLHYDLDRVYILECAADAAPGARVTYEWHRSGLAPRRGLEQSKVYYGAREHLFVCRDAAADTLEPAVRAELQALGARAIMQYALHENGKFNGTLTFEDCRSPRAWTEEEIDSLMIISKFIGSFLVKMQVQNEIEKLAYTDPLTGMWNLNKFKLAAENLLQPLQEGAEKQYALICFDIKKFRYINDTFGFEVGDDILLYIARRLKRALTGEMIFARMTADKFLILLSYRSCERLNRSLGFMMRNAQYFTSAKTGRYKLIFNAGVYLIHRENVSTINSMVDKADIARSKAHCGHDNRIVFYNETFRQKLMQEKEIEDLVDGALENREFIVYYQPKVDLSSGRIKGAEALVRWRSPLKGFLCPADFIPLFERNGFIAKLDFYVFERVFADLRRWIDEGKALVPVSVNLSRVHLSDGSFIGRLLALAERYAVPPRLVEIELTESVFTENIAGIIEVMQQLKAVGFQISIDDFGSGYSSLRLLRDIPADYLKLDKEFLDNGDTSLREQVIIMNVIRMAKTLGIKVVSEGVETVTQATFLKGCACDLVQGFLYARPMPVEDFEVKLRGALLKMNPSG